MEPTHAWIYREQTGQYVLVPTKRMKLAKAKNGKVLYLRRRTWAWVSYGFTKGECWDRVTEQHRKLIEWRREELASAERLLLGTFGPRPED